MDKGVGIYIGNKKVVACRLGQKKGVYQLKQFSIEPIQDDPSSKDPQESLQKGKSKKSVAPESRAVERALEKIGKKNAVVHASFSPFHLATRFFQMPAIPSREWREAIRYEAVRYMPYKLEESYFDYYAETHEAGAKGKSLRVAFTAVKKQVLKNYLDHLRQGSARVASIEPPFTSMARALSVVESGLENQTWGGIFIDSEGSVNISIAAGKIVYLSRDFILTDDQVANEARFYQEIKSSFDFLAERLAGQNIAKFFLAGDGDLFFWRDFLANVFGKEVSFELADFPVEMDIPKHVLSALIVPIGLALRGFEKKSPVGTLALLPPTERPLDQKTIKRLLFVELGLAVLLFGAARLVFLDPFVADFERRVAHDTTEINITDSALSAKPLGELRQLKKQTTSEIEQFSGIARIQFTPRNYIAAIANVMTPAIKLDSLSFSSGAARTRFDSPEARIGRDDKRVEIKGVCFMNHPEKEIQEINRFVKKLSEDAVIQKEFGMVTLEEARRGAYGSRTVTQFQIVIKK